MATIVSALSCWMSDLYFTVIGAIEAASCHVLFAALLTSADLHMSSVDKTTLPVTVCKVVLIICISPVEIQQQ